MELPDCQRFNSAPTVTGAPRIVEWQPFTSGRAYSRAGFIPSPTDFLHLLREEQIFRYLVDRPGADRLPLHNTSRQKYLPAVIDEE
jgi:hypothetical protein